MNPSKSEPPTRSTGRELGEILANAPLMLLVTDPEGRVVFASGQTLAQVLGEPGPFTGRLVPQLTQAPEVLKDLFLRAATGTEGVGRLALPGGVLELRVGPTLDAAGRIEGIVGVGVREIPQASSDEAFLRLFEASPVPISISTLETGVFSHCNEAFVRVFGYPREEVVGRGSVELGMWTPEQRAAAIGELRAKGFLAGHESTVRTKSGVVRDTIFNMERIQFAGRTHLVGFFYDITERKNAEREQRSLYEQLRELDKLKGQVIANVSHELRTPLTLIIGLTERILHAPALVPSRDRDLLAVHRNAKGLLRQVNELLDIARLDARQILPRYSDVDLAAALRLAASPFDVLAAEAGISYELRTPEHLAAEMDAEKFERITVNLLSNAFKFTPRGGTVCCSLSAGDDVVALTVSDSGPGITPSDRLRVFERFFQVEGDATRTHGGTGLGLAIVREFAETLRGTATVTDAAEGGARFRIELPLRAPQGVYVAPSGEMFDTDLARTAVQELRPDTSPEPATASATGDDRALVLVVEDNAEMRRFLVECLATDHRVITAGDGAEGLAIAVAHRPDVVVTDMMMPRMSGDQLLQAMRADERLADTRGLLLTAKVDEDLRARMLRDGAHDFLTKPFSVAELRARVGNQVDIKRKGDTLREEVRAGELAAGTLAEQLRAAQKMEAIGRLAGGVAHDFNNLITVIGGYASLLQETEAEGGLAHDFASQIKSAADRAAELTRQLLAFSRRQVLKLQVLDVNVLVFGLEKMLTRLIGEDIRMTTRLAPGIGSVNADPGQLEQVIMNLVVNARDAMSAGGTLVIETSEVALGEAAGLPGELAAGSYVLITVTDDGAGMSDDVQQRIFEPFFTTKEVGKGTGLGLATVYGIIKQTGGHIAFTSQLGHGTQFNVYLPKVAEAALEERPDVRAALLAGTETVMLVEDDTMVREFTAWALRRLGYDVTEAVDGPDALRQCELRDQPFDILVTDVVMPVFSGRELSLRIKERWPDTRVLFLSGYTEDAVLRHGVERDGLQFLQKPFTSAVLARAMRKALS